MHLILQNFIAVNTKAASIKTKCQIAVWGDQWIIWIHHVRANNKVADWQSYL